jgi:hypothetical protein
MLKHCYVCKLSKDISLFGKNRSKKDGLACECKKCKKQKDKEYSSIQENAEKIRKKALEWYYNNTEQAKEKMKVVGKKWREDNRDRWNTKAARYRASKLKATPPWLSTEQLKDIETEYSLASWCSEVLKTSYHVDHIIPLKGKLVCGLHVPWNLQVIPAAVNLSKGNRIVI